MKIRLFFSFIACVFCFLPPQETHFINIGLFVEIFCAVKIMKSKEILCCLKAVVVFFFKFHPLLGLLIG